jgi:ABC-2 type transport system permease protein
LAGHSWRWLAITRHGIRIGMRNILLRIMVLLAWFPAVVLAFSLCVWGLLEQKSTLVEPLLDYLSFLGPEILADPKAYRVEIWTLCYQRFLVTEMRFSMILVLLVGPSLISRDLRFNALPLYFSRPLRRIDYFIGKLGVVGYFLGLVLIVPTLIAYALGLLFSLDITIIRDTFPLLLAALGYGILMTLSAGLVILALSSLSRNSRFVGLFWLAVWFVTSIASTVLDAVHQADRSNRIEHRIAAEQRALLPDTPSKSKSHQDMQKQFATRQQVIRKLAPEIEQEEIADAKSNWRPMVSYNGNLTRVGSHWLGTDAVWERLSQDVPEERRTRFLLEAKGPQYPWYWSAFVLAGLFGISVCTLNLRVKSLDRLK